MPESRSNPDRYENSESYFRILCLITYLQRHMGVRYNPAKIDSSTPLDTADVFVHGALLGEGGTCASLPVVYASIGRQLGYPIRLVQAITSNSGHLFCWWDDRRGERFNIEGSGRGLNCYPDEHYRSGIYASTRDYEKKAKLLVSLTPREELAGFLVQRGLRWLEFGKRGLAGEAIAWAHGLRSNDEIIYNTLTRTVAEWHEVQMARKPQPFPKIQFGNLNRKFAPVMPLGAVLQILF